jgi:hypothetical protein
MTPQAIAELIAEAVAALGDRGRGIDPVQLRREAARDLFGSLRRTGQLEEPPCELPRLPAHPDIPEPGVWIRAVRRVGHHDEPVTVVWHSYEGTYQRGRRGLVVLHALCARDQKIWESDDGTRVYVECRREQPEDACRLCLRRRDQIAGDSGQAAAS